MIIEDLSSDLEEFSTVGKVNSA